MWPIKPQLLILKINLLLGKLIFVTLFFSKFLVYWHLEYF